MYIFFLLLLFLLYSHQTFLHQSFPQELQIISNAVNQGKKPHSLIEMAIILWFGQNMFKRGKKLEFMVKSSIIQGRNTAVNQKSAIQHLFFKIIPLQRCNLMASSYLCGKVKIKMVMDLEFMVNFFKISTRNWDKSFNSIDIKQAISRLLQSMFHTAILW